MARPKKGAVEADVPPPSVAAHAPHGSSVALSLAALGVVFGDIGTSPLYTMQMAAGESDTEASILGVLSLIFWSLMMVVTIKYLTFIMRADNRGEGGILALLALVPPDDAAPGKKRHPRVGWVALLVVAGAALLYGDGIITPAISVLSAIEGLKLAAPSVFDLPVIVCITIAILIGLFAIQSRGTGAMGKLFGPVMLVWFFTIGALGVAQIAKNPSIVRALSPSFAVKYFMDNGVHGLPILGVVVLCVTGGEALYADMGHFGARPIRIAWLGLALPALVLNYFGQGALLLRDPAARDNPFFALVPTGGFTYALVVLSAFATIIASQALISGVFSLTHQAIQLGYFPRVTVTHTSKEAEGQIYVAQMNWGLMIACVLLVITFRESARLASAYGIAVSGTMAITSIVFFVVTRRTWGWPLWKSLPLLVLFLSFDIPFFVVNLTKFMDGGYVPLLVGAGFFVAMVNWKIGRSILREHIVERSPALPDFLALCEKKLAARVPGTAVFMASMGSGVPSIVVHHVERIRVLHETVVLLTVVFDHVPFVGSSERLKVEQLQKGFIRVTARYGFMQHAHIPELLAEAKRRFDLPIELGDATYYLGRETFLATSKGKMGAIGETLFSFLARNAKPATTYFNLPPEQVVELGTQIDL